MQVSNAANAVVSSVASANKSEAFTFANTPEAFSVFFASLYKNPLLAFVREALCNAWDAHIAAENTHTPITVTLEDGYLTVADSGTGIPLEGMRDIYCTIGASTKKNDGRQTGGFGYGCKSPFAYTDNFEVTSHHGGRKGIFRLLRSDPNENGFPSCTNIVTLPTNHTGLTVKVPVPSRVIGDIFHIVSLVAYLGSIKVNLNGELQPMLNMGMAAGSYKILPPVLRNSGLTTGTLFVRYGNVVYPIPKHANYIELYTGLEEFLHALFSHGNTHRKGALILQAAPDSLAITPSREELSLQDLTIEGITTLLENFTKEVPEEILQHLHTAIDHAEAQYLATATLPEILSTIFHKGNLTPYQKKVVNTIPHAMDVTSEMVVLVAMQERSGLYLKTYKRVILGRLNHALAMAPREHIPLVRACGEQIKRHLADSVSWPTSIPLRPDFKVTYQHYLRKAICAHNDHPLLRTKDLLVWDASTEIPRVRNAYFTDRQPPFHDVQRTLSLVNPFGVLKNTVCIAYTKANIMTRIQGRLGKSYLNGTLVYVLPNRKAATREQAINTFSQAGYHVEDLTQFITSEHVYKSEVERTALLRESTSRHYGTAPVVTKQGILALSNILREDGSVDITKYRDHPDPVYVSKPDAVVHIPLNKDTSDISLHIDGKAKVHAATLQEIVKLYGDRVAIVPLVQQYCKHKTSRTLGELITEDLTHYLVKCPRYLSTWRQDAFDIAVGTFSYRTKVVAQDICDYPNVREFVGFSDYSGAPASDATRFSLFTTLERKGHFKEGELPHPKVKVPAKDLRLLRKLETATTIQYLRHQPMKDVSEDLTSDIPEKVAGAKAFLRLIFKHTFEAENGKN